MSGSRWVSTLLWLSGSFKPFFFFYFLYNPSMYPCHLFLISSASVRSLPFLSFIEPIFAWNFLLVSLIFLKSSSLSHSIVFSVSLHCLLKKAFFLISWRLITLQYCSGFCHTLIRISHGFTCIPHPDPPSHLPLDPIPLSLPSAPGLSTCLMHPTWAGDLFHPR